MSNPAILRRLSILLFAASHLPLAAEMQITQSEAMRAAIKIVQPAYNPIARQMRIQGDVEVAARISDAGEVVDVKVISGNAMLTAPVLKAVKDWRFQPFHDKGKPVEASVALRFVFKL